LRRKEEEKSEDKKRTTTQKKKRKIKIFSRRASSLHSSAKSSGGRGTRGERGEKEREKERDRQRETFIASGGFRRFLSFSLNNEKKKKRDKRKEYERIFNNVGRWRGTRKRKTQRQSTSFQREKEIR
jgi:hypothetical protein